MNKSKSVVLIISCIVISLNSFLHADIRNNTAKEVIRYNIKYGFINGGEVEFRTDVTEYENRLVYHTRVDAKTRGLIDQLYRVHDIYESYYDMRTGLPKLAIQNLSEGKYRHYDEVKYNQTGLSAYSSKKDTSFDLYEPTYDVISAIQYLRSMDWNKMSYNDTITIATQYDKEPFPIYVVYKGNETLTIGSYKYSCHLFSPVIDPGKILKKKESIQIWFSDDENKIPINIRLNLVVGAFRLEFDHAEILPYPFTSQMNKK